MNVTAKHTPTPWVAEGSYWIIPQSHRERAIGGSTNKHEHIEKFAHVIARVEQDEKRFTHEQVEANAALIVRAVNAHPKLVEVLKAVRDLIQADRHIPLFLVEMALLEAGEPV